MYLYDEDPEDDDEEESDTSLTTTEEKQTEEKPPIGECKIVSIYWQKGSRALQKVWRGVTHKVIQNQAGEWVEAKNEKEEPIEFEYYLNHSIYPMIQASSLNNHVRLITGMDV